MGGEVILNEETPPWIPLWHSYNGHCLICGPRTGGQCQLVRPKGHNERLAIAKGTFVIYQTATGDKLGLVEVIDETWHAVVKFGAGGPIAKLLPRFLRQATDVEIEEHMNRW